jgi:hypothetical protein
LQIYKYATEPPETLFRPESLPFNGSSPLAVTLLMLLTPDAPLFPAGKPASQVVHSSSTQQRSAQQIRISRRSPSRR